MSYARFGAMIATSTVLMFCLTYASTYALAHVWFSETRAWMALAMGGLMAVVMLAFMWRMYPSDEANGAVLLTGLIVLAAGVWLVRSQDSIDDVAYMKAMIPHHSIAILTSRRAHIRDPRVRRLADAIIETQLREIDEMQKLLAKLVERPVAPGAPDLEPRLADAAARSRIRFRQNLCAHEFLHLRLGSYC